MIQHFLLTLLLSCVVAMKEPAAAQAPPNLTANSNQPQVARHDSAKNDTVKIRELVDRQVRAWEKHDFGIAAPDWLPSGELISPGGDHVPAGEIPTAIAGYFKHFSDVRVTVKNVFVSTDGAKAAIEWDWDVTRRRDGARAVTHDAIIVDLVGGKIASWREYFDFGNSIDAKP